MADLTNVIDEETAKDILAYALDHYDEGWDFILECYSKSDIIELTGHCGTHGGYSTYSQALAKVADFVETYNSHRDDIRAEIF